MFDVKSIAEEALKLPMTKRSLLSAGAKFYDPLGLISPIVIVMKIIFQKVCLDKSDWDDELPDELKLIWLNYLHQLRDCGYISIPRFVFSDIVQKVEQVDIHGFCDSSKNAYSAAVYLRIKSSDGYSARLISSKTKVAPAKEVTIPRLELLGCLLLAQLVFNITEVLKGIVNLQKIFYWTDSRICLTWIKDSHKEWKSWVENRVNKIRDLSIKEDWLHVPGILNPADIPTRDINVKEFVNNSLWWNGPEFLASEMNEWPSQDIINTTEEVIKNVGCEMRKNIKFKEVSTYLIDGASNISCEEKEELFKLKVLNLKEIIVPEKFSSLGKLFRITAYVLRFINNTKRNTKKKSGVINAEEISVCENLWIKFDQQEIKNNKQFFNVKKQLNLFEDENGFIRLKGRLGNAEINFDNKFPILLNEMSHVTKLFVIDAHKRVKHSGVNGTLNELRSRFWISSGRNVVKRCIRECIPCKRINGKVLLGPPPPDLPGYRVASDFAFTNIGVDYAGPLFVKNIYSETDEMHKAYICLFTCASTRNVHLELTPSMNTESLIRCLKRFTARRGVSKMVISDNFKTFLSEELQEYLAREGISWKYILQKSPWWGGFYERLIRIVKESLRKVLGTARLTYEEVETLLLEIEMTINSRPLTYLCDDPVEALTPSHLVIGRRLLSKFDHLQNYEYDEFNETSDNMNKKLRYLKTLLDRYGRKFQSEYLNELREKHLYNQRKCDVANKLNVGDVVLIKDDEIKTRNLWKQGVIHELIIGDDGHIRGAVLRIYVKGRISCIKRPVQRLVPLEVNKEINYINGDKTVKKHEDVTIARPRRLAAITGELKRRILFE